MVHLPATRIASWGQPGNFIADGWHGRLTRAAGPLAWRKGGRRTQVPARLGQPRVAPVPSGESPDGTGWQPGICLAAQPVWGRHPCLPVHGASLPRVPGSAASVRRRGERAARMPPEPSGWKPDPHDRRTSRAAKHIRQPVPPRSVRTPMKYPGWPAYAAPNGERTRPACRFERPAQTLVPQSAHPATPRERLSRNHSVRATGARPLGRRNARSAWVSEFSGLLFKTYQMMTRGTHSESLERSLRAGVSAA